MGVLETKTFRSGNSVALRLPKALAIGPDERMVIEQNGDVLTVRRLHDPASEKRKVAALLAALAACLMMASRNGRTSKPRSGRASDRCRC
jgi:antitoxin VapB